MLSFPLGSQVDIIASFARPDGYVPPFSGVTLQLTKPDTITTTTALTGSDGTYTYICTLDQPGDYYYRITATGLYRGTTGDQAFHVDSSSFAAIP